MRSRFCSAMEKRSTPVHWLHEFFARFFILFYIVWFSCWSRIEKTERASFSHSALAYLPLLHDFSSFSPRYRSTRDCNRLFRGLSNMPRRNIVQGWFCLSSFSNEKWKIFFAYATSSLSIRVTYSTKTLHFKIFIDHMTVFDQLVWWFTIRKIAWDKFLIYNLGILFLAGSTETLHILGKDVQETLCMCTCLSLNQNKKLGWKFAELTAWLLLRCQG